MAVKRVIKKKLTSITFKKISENVFRKHKWTKNMSPKEMNTILELLKTTEGVHEPRLSGIIHNYPYMKKAKEYKALAFYTMTYSPACDDNWMVKTTQGKYVVERNTSPGHHDTMEYYEAIVK